MRLFIPVLALGLLAGVQEASAQFSAQKDAQYIATLKAVVNYKINDEENLKDIESLRQNHDRTVSRRLIFKSIPV